MNYLFFKANLLLARENREPGKGNHSGKKKLLAGDEKRFCALKSHGLSAYKNKFGTHHLLIKVNNLAVFKNYGL